MTLIDDADADDVPLVQRFYLHAILACSLHTAKLDFIDLI
jgi:hypothetical protein